MAAAVIQSAARARCRLTAATRAVTVTRRAKTSSFKICESPGAVLHTVEDCAEMPGTGATPWLWTDPGDPWWGITPQALCRRAGRPDAIVSLRDRKILTVRALARSSHGRKAHKGKKLSKAQEAEELALDECSAVAKAVLERFVTRANSLPGDVVYDSQETAETNASSALAQAALLEDCRALHPAERHDAIFEVCALRFGNLSRRKRETGDVSGVQLAKLPGPCKALIFALEEPSQYLTGNVPFDMSKAAYRKFASRHADAERALKALEAGELSRPPWSQNKAEYELDAKRVRTGTNHRRVALERIKALLEAKDPDFANRLLGKLVLKALDEGKAAMDLAEARRLAATKAAARATAEQKAREQRALEAKAAEEKRKEDKAQGKAGRHGKSGAAKKGPAVSKRHGAKKPAAQARDDASSKASAHGADESSAAGATATTATTASAASAAASHAVVPSKGGGSKKPHFGFAGEMVVREDVPGFVKALRLTQPEAFATLDMFGMRLAAPGAARSEELVSLGAAAVVYSGALVKIAAYEDAAIRLVAAVRTRSARRVTAIARHARAVGAANALYLAERRGEAVKAAWERDMAAFAKAQDEEEAAWLANQALSAAEGRCAGCLRFGWRAVDVRLGQLGALRDDDSDDDLDNGTMMRCYERPRPPKGKTRSRGGRRLERGLISP